MEFFTDWLTDVFKLAYSSSIMAKTTGLIFPLFNVALAQEVPFSVPQYVQCILHGLTSAPLGGSIHQWKKFIIYKADSWKFLIVC